MQKVKEFLKSKEMRRVTMLCMALCVMAISCFAADGDAATVTSAFTTGFTQVVTDAKSMIAATIPIALGLAGTIFLVRKAMGWFKSMAK